jgi:hypothetical protein
MENKGTPSIETPADGQKMEARELLIRVKLYRFFALTFAFVGLALFAYMYHSHSGSNPLEALANPVIVVFLAVPFLPAFILSLKARKYEEKLLKIIGTLGE